MWFTYKKLIIHDKLFRNVIKMIILTNKVYTLIHYFL